MMSIRAEEEGESLSLCVPLRKNLQFNYRISSDYIKLIRGTFLLSVRSKKSLFLGGIFSYLKKSFL